MKKTVLVIPALAMFALPSHAGVLKFSAKHVVKPTAVVVAKTSKTIGVKLGRGSVKTAKVAKKVIV